jgi:hypothetical protein
MQYAQHDYFIAYHAIIYGVWKTAGQCPPDVAIYRTVDLRSAPNTLKHLVNTQEKRRPKPFALVLIPVASVYQISLRFRADDHGVGS